METLHKDVVRGNWWQTTIDRRDPAQVVVVDVPKDDDLHVLAPQFGGTHAVEFLLQYGKKALHAGVA